MSPSAAMTQPELDPTTYLAVGELVQAAAHQHGLTGPIPYEVLTEPQAAELARYLRNTEVFDT